MPAGKASPQLPAQFANWFAARGWQVRPHQLSLLAAAEAGRSVLLIAPTGAGKTLAGFLPTLTELKDGRDTARPDQPETEKAPDTPPARLLSRTQAERPTALHTLYISPLKALAVDIARNLERPIAEMGLPVRVETRTGDTPANRRARQRRDPPDILLTTPEQISLLLASRDAEHLFSGLKRVVLDELHALVTSKRGDLLALALARLRQLSRPAMRRPFRNGCRTGCPAPLSDAAGRSRARRVRPCRSGGGERWGKAGCLHPENPRAHALGQPYGPACGAGHALPA